MEYEEKAAFCSEKLGKRGYYHSHYHLVRRNSVRKCPVKQEIYYRCHSNVNKENLPVNPQVQRGGFSVMFWGIDGKAHKVLKC